jgi:hypothetical protein
MLCRTSQAGHVGPINPMWVAMHTQTPAMLLPAPHFLPLPLAHPVDCPPQVMGPSSQAERLAALPDLAEVTAWMLHLQVVAGSTPEAYAWARGVAVEVALQQEFGHQLGRLRLCGELGHTLGMLTTPACHPDELQAGSRAGGCRASVSAAVKYFLELAVEAQLRPCMHTCM